MYRVTQLSRTFLRYHIFAATTCRYNHAVLAEVFRNYSRRQQENNFLKRVLNILCKVVKVWYLVNISANRLYNSNNMNVKVCHRAVRVCLIQAMLNMSTSSRKDQGKSFENWSMAVSTKSWLIINYDVVHFRLLCKEYLTLV